MRSNKLAVLIPICLALSLGALILTRLSQREYEPSREKLRPESASGPHAESKAPRPETLPKPGLPLAKAHADSPSDVSASFQSAKAEIQNQYSQVLALNRVRAELLPKQYFAQLADLATQLARSLGDTPIPLLLSVLDESRDPELSSCILESLLSIWDEGNTKFVLYHLAGSGRRNTRPLEAALALEMLEIAQSADRPLEFRALILEKMGPRVEYDAVLYSRLSESLAVETSPLLRGLTFRVMSEQQGALSPKEGQTLFAVARRYLSEEAEEMRAAAATVLSKDPTAVDVLANALSTETNKAVKYEELKSLVWIGLTAPQLSEELRDKLARQVLAVAADSDPKISAKAVSHVGELVTKATALESYKILDQAITNGPTSLREQALRSLEKVASAGYLKETIRGRLLELASDGTLPRKLRDGLVATAERIK